MLCYVMLCYVMLCYVMLCYVMLCYVSIVFTLTFLLLFETDDLFTNTKNLIFIVHLYVCTYLIKTCQL